MNKNSTRKLKGLEADLASVGAKIAQELHHKAQAQRELSRMKFTSATHSALARNGGQFPPDVFNL